MAPRQNAVAGVGTGSFVPASCIGRGAAGLRVFCFFFLFSCLFFVRCLISGVVATCMVNGAPLATLRSSMLQYVR